MAELTEEKIFEALGVSANEQEVADPAAQEDGADTAPEGGNEQEVADPANDDGSDQEEYTEEASEEATQREEEKEVMDPQQRRANAARRRQQEQQEAVDRAVAAALEQERKRQREAQEEFFKKAELLDSFTGEKITNMEQFDKWHKQYSGKRLEQDLKAGKLTPEGLEQAIGQHPAVQQAQQLMQQREAEEQARQDAREQARIEGEIAQISKLDPSIKEVRDLLTMPNAKEFYALVQRGYSFADAFYVVNRERLENARAEAARQQAASNARGKSHLRGVSSGRGAGAVSVPREELALFRSLNPGASDDAIQKFYNDYKKGMKGG